MATHHAESEGAPCRPSSAVGAGAVELAHDARPPTTTVGNRDLFVCHSSTDKEFVEEIGADIEAELCTVFIDKWDIEGGDNIVLKLNEALSSARFVAIVMSPEMISSDWCSAEWSSILHQDPSNRRGRILPLRRRDFHLKTGARLAVPPMLDALNYFDFRRDQDYAKSFQRLLAKIRGEAPPRGAGRGRIKRPTSDHSSAALVPALPPSREQPDAVPEVLLSNLLPVRSFPKTIWCAPTTLRDKSDIPKGISLPPFILKDKALYTFWNLSTPRSRFRSFADPKRATRIGTVEWRDREDRWRWFIELMNRSLGDHLRQSGIRFDHDHHRYFFHPNGAKTRYVTWGSGTRRWVVRAPDDPKKGYWVHHAARLRFETLDSKIYLSIEPAMVFTSDGRKPVSKETAGPLSMKWSGRERNGAIIRHVLMWSDVLTAGRREVTINADEQSIVIGRLPTTVRTTVGIADDRVAVGALLKFTRVELDPSAEDAAVFAFEDVEDDEAGGQ